MSISCFRHLATSIPVLQGSSMELTPYYVVLTRYSFQDPEPPSDKRGGLLGAPPPPPPDLAPLPAASIGLEIAEMCVAWWLSGGFPPIPSEPSPTSILGSPNLSHGCLPPSSTIRQSPHIWNLSPVMRPCSAQRATLSSPLMFSRFAVWFVEACLRGCTGLWGGGRGWGGGLVGRREGWGGCAGGHNMSHLKMLVGGCHFLLQKYLVPLLRPPQQWPLLVGHREGGAPTAPPPPGAWATRYSTPPPTLQL